VTTKSLRPEIEDAASWKESVTLRLAWWIAATAPTPIATPKTGRTKRAGCRRAGPVTSARIRRRNALPARGGERLAVISDLI
jgi:hypothetical protein